MAPPLFAALIVVIVVLVVLVGALWAVRTGLWVRETGKHDDTEEVPGSRSAGDRSGKRPEHVAVENPTRVRQQP